MLRHSYFEPVFFLAVEQIEIIEYSFCFCAKPAHHEHDSAQTSSCMLHAFSRHFSFVDDLFPTFILVCALGIPNPQIVKTHSESDFSDKSTRTSKEHNFIPIGT